MVPLLKKVWPKGVWNVAIREETQNARRMET